MAAKFKLSDEARKFFSEVRRKDELSTDFDIFYLCAMAGLLAERKGDLAGTTEFIDYFPSGYKERSKLIVGAFVALEIKKSGVPYTEKKRVHAEMRNLIDPQSTTHLSDDGIHEMNRFAAGGLEFLMERLDEKPRRLDEFVVLYADLFN